MSSQSQIPFEGNKANTKNPLAATALVQIKGAKKDLGKEHLAFNKLTKRIENLQKKIDGETKKMDSLHLLYHQEVYGKVLELGNHKIKLSQLLHLKRGLIRLSNLQNEKLDQVIIDLLDDAFSVIEPDEATKEIYDHYTGGDFDEEVKMDEEQMKTVFSEMFYRQFGLKIDPSELGENPDFEKIEKDLNRQLEERGSHTKPRKKTKKQQEREALELQKEELKKKSLRSIYLSLAKLLHPDTEKDEDLKIEKEEVMKKVTTAYNNKNMMQLLQLQMQWLNAHKQSLDNTDVNTVAVYVQLLKDQVQQLEFELDMVMTNPKYSRIHHLQSQPEPIAKIHIGKMAYEYQVTNNNVAALVQGLENSQFPNQAIKQCIQEYYVAPSFPMGRGDW